MTNHYARARRNRGSFYEGLLADQSTHLDGITLDDLREYGEDLAASGQRHALIVTDNPPPTRAYALITAAGPGIVVGRAHVLDGQPDAVARALFSQTLVQARLMAASEELQILIDPETTTEHTRERIERLGGEYGIEMSQGWEPEAGTDAGDAADGPETDDQGSEGEEPTPEQSDAADELLGEGQGAPEPVEITETEREAYAAAGIEVNEETGELTEEGSDEADEAEDVEIPDEPTEENAAVCEECGKTFGSAQALGAHSRAHKTE